MTDRVSAPPTAWVPPDPAEPTTGGLRRNSMTVGHIVFFVVAAAAPLTVVGSLFSVIVGIGNGDGIAGAFLLVSVILLVFAVGYTAMSRHVVDAGDFYAFVSLGLGRPFGLGAAGLAIFGYTAIQLGVVGAFGYFASALAADRIGLDLPWWAWAFAALAACLVIGIRRIDLGARVMGILLILETVAILIVDVAIVVKGGSPDRGWSFEPLSPSATFSGAVGVAFMFAHASFIGFESTAIYGEESKDPRRAVPRATYIAVLFLGIFYTVTAWLVINAFGPGEAVTAAQTDPGGFFFDIGGSYVGESMVTVLTVLIVTSLFAAIVAFHNTVSRYFFALGRQGILWNQLGRTHDRHSSPWVACCMQAGLAFAVVAIFALLGRDPFLELFTWLTGVGAVAVILLQSLAGLAIIVFFRRRDLDRRAWNTVVAPVLSLGGLMMLLYFAFNNFSTLVGATGGVAAVLLACLFGSFLVGLALALVLRRRKPELYERVGPQLRTDSGSPVPLAGAAPVR